MPKPHTISIIIPAYNEADTIQACLDAIARQTVMPHEVIVVDNNSTDNTALLAQRYAFVRVMAEPRQGVVHARNVGFDAATGDIIGRIDADTVISSDWVEKLQHIFASDSVDVVTGGIRYHAIPFPRFFSAADRLIRGYLAMSMGSEVGLLGANMALRRRAWQSVRNATCANGGIHEDLDIGIHLHATSHRAIYVSSLNVSMTFRQAASGWTAYYRYVTLTPGTYAQHARWKRVMFYPLVLLGLVAYPVIHALYLAYDNQQAKLSFRRLVRSTARARVNPATFVD